MSYDNIGINSGLKSVREKALATYGVLSDICITGEKVDEDRIRDLPRLLDDLITHIDDALGFNKAIEELLGRK